MKRIIFILGIILLMVIPAESQSLKKMGNKLKETSSKEAEKQVNKTIDDAFNKSDEQSQTNDNTGNETAAKATSNTGVSQELWTKYDFVPGDTVIFEDLLANEQNGEFPSKWDLKTGNVEIAELNGESVINFPSTKNSEIVPLMKEKGDYLPEKFTIEFDAYFTEFCTKFEIKLYDVVNQQKNPDLPRIIISPKDIFIYNKGKTTFDENKNYPYWQHIAISFNIRSLKIYFGEERIANIPNLGGNPSGFSILASQCHEGNAALIKNIRIAKGSMNLYDRVMTDGKFITNGIRFDVGKATLRPESMGVINQIYKLMSEHANLSFSVEGHTDSDGNEASNQKLSEERAAAVKDVLVEKGIAADRLSTSGLGESQPIDTNNTPEGKANNRRVEFIKI
ncbi:OmpA family protein [Carboxylicivirga sediminis]|uniref:OmpA family protein n=1 Tax=Carboxylicivirga sediminis TaxID=2006564 RepID=A0A941F851_9BACT|nr:OmpA family protein [Carboxylicivirga sediminis]MBR8537005.1 OmpA family protein [Carboxylicivirga sediminis]